MAEAQQPQSAEAQCAAGEAAFLAHDYRTARALLTAAAEAGCARAMACLGLLLRDCYGVGDDSITTEATELLSSLTPTQVAAVMPPSPRGLATSRSAIPSRTASNGSSSSSSSASASSSIAGVLTARSSSPRLGAAPPVRIAKLSIASLMARQPLLSGSGDGAVMRSSTATSSASESALDDEDDDANGVTAHANGVAGAGAGVGAGLEFAFDGAASPLSSTRTTPTPRAASSPTPTPPPPAAVTTATATMAHAQQQAPPGLPTASTTTSSSSSLLHRPQLRSIAGMVVAASEHHVGLRASYGVLDSSFDDEELHLSNGSNGDMSMLMAVDQPNNEQQQHQKHHQQAGAAVLDAMSIAPSRDATLQHLNGHHDANSREATAALESLSLDWQPVEHESVRWLERGMALGCPLSQHQLAVALRKGWGTVRDKQRAQNLITDAVTRVLQLAAINESAIARARQQSHKEEQECCNDKDNDKDDDDDDDDEEEADHDGEQQHGIDGTRAESAPTASIELDWLLQYLKAFSYRVGFGCATDLPEARRIFLALAKRGIAVAQKHLAKMWLKGLGGPKNALKAVKWMSRAAEQGHRAAQYDLAVMSERGQGCERDAARHYALLEQAAKQGHGNALYACARRFKRACSEADPSFSLAKRLYTLASRAGNEHAQYNLALMFKRGEGGEVNLTKARQLFELAAANGYPRARYNLAKMLANGEGGERDAATARRLYRKAARKGHADSKFNLALMYWKGLGGTQNHAEARRLFSELASAGDADACFSFACMLRSGDGGPKDLTRARELLQHAANAGFVRANCALASMLEKGRGGERDCKEAFRLRLLAAEHDNDLGQYRVAIMYEEGIGTPQNYAKAFQWYLIAAKSNGVKSPKATERAERMLRELRAPWSPHVHTRFPRAIQDQIGTLLRLSLFDETTGLPRFPEAPLWMLPPEILFEIAQEIVKSQRIDIVVATLP